MNKPNAMQLWFDETKVNYAYMKGVVYHVCMLLNDELLCPFFVVLFKRQTQRLSETPLPNEVPG